MLFPEGGTPRVVTLGGQRRLQRTAYVPYTDDPGTGLRWVAMDETFQHDFVPALAQQNVHVQWVEDHVYVEGLQALSALVGVELSAGAGAILAAAVLRLRTS